MNVTKVVKLLAIILMLLAFFHPIATVVFIATHFGVISAFIIIYVVIRVALGMSILKFIAKTLNEDN